MAVEYTDVASVQDAFILMQEELGKVEMTATGHDLQELSLAIIRLATSIKRLARKAEVLVEPDVDKWAISIPTR